MLSRISGTVDISIGKPSQSSVFQTTVKYNVRRYLAEPDTFDTVEIYMKDAVGFIILIVGYIEYAGGRCSHKSAEMQYH